MYKQIWNARHSFSMEKAPFPQFHVQVQGCQSVSLVPTLSAKIAVASLRFFTAVRHCVFGPFCFELFSETSTR